MTDFTPRSTTSALVFGRDRFYDNRVERTGDNLLRALFQPGSQLDPVPMLREFDLVAHKVTMTPSDRTQLIRVEWRPDEALRKDALFQVIMLGPGARLVDVIRHDTALAGSDEDGSFRRTIACRGVNEVVFASASRNAAGSFSLALSRPRQTPVLMATSWNCPSGQFLTQDPREMEWTWMSPDLEVVRDFTQKDSEGNLQEARMIRLAVQNIGPRGAVLYRATVSFCWRLWSAGPTGAWNDAGTAQIANLSPVDDHDRARRGGRITEDTRMMGRRFVQVPAPGPEDAPSPYMIRAIFPSSGDRRDQHLVVLGSSEPMSINDTRVGNRGLADWVNGGGGQS
jgi:hypothetical protein